MDNAALDGRNVRMLAESAVLFGGLFALCLWADAHDLVAVALLAGVAQGFWFQRLYVIGHEAAHRNLSPQRRVNDGLGQVALAPLLIPMTVFRAIHRFHHGGNRRDARTSALDVFVMPQGAGPLRRSLAWITWYLAVFAGGWFLHGLVSVVLFLGMPPKLARKVSPAFHRWERADQARAIAGFGLGLALHLGVAWAFGVAGWFAALGVPFLTFAWVYSAQLYIYHYRTTMGPRVHFHARSVRASALVRWWLLNLPLHATHHRHPRVRWYELQPEIELPPEFERNRCDRSWIGAVFAQLAGPTLVTGSAGARP